MVSSGKGGVGKSSVAGESSVESWVCLLVGLLAWELWRQARGREGARLWYTHLADLRKQLLERLHALFLLLLASQLSDNLS